jgi:hypothetical protein
VQHLLTLLGNTTQYPPKKFCGIDVNSMDFQYCTEKRIGSYNSRNYSLPLLLDREIVYYAHLTAYIKVISIDFEKIRRQTKPKGGVALISLGESIGTYIQDLYDELLGYTGNQYLAQRIACFLLQAQVNLDVLKRIPFFGTLFRSSAGLYFISCFSIDSNSSVTKRVKDANASHSADSNSPSRGQLFTEQVCSLFLSLLWFICRNWMKLISCPLCRCILVISTNFQQNARILNTKPMAGSTSVRILSV